jgi:hypothetical protein
MGTRYVSACLVLRGVLLWRPRPSRAFSATPNHNPHQQAQASAPAGGAFVESRQHLHVGNLDWTRSVAQVSDDLTQALLLGGGLSSSDDDLEDALPDRSSSSSVVSIAVKPVRPDRVRDNGKCHGGSAVLEFSSAVAATAAWDALCAGANNNNNYRIKYAVLEQVAPLAPPPTPEDIARRQERATRYAARRVRLAERTDAVLERLAASNDDYTEQPLPVLEAPLLDWMTCPAPWDPLQGGGLDAGSARGTRKRAAVEAFYTVVATLLGLGGGPADNNEDDARDEAASSPATSVRLADLGCGSGNLAVPLQWALQSASTHSTSSSMLAVDRNPQSLERLVARLSSTTHVNLTVDVLNHDLQDMIRMEDTDSLNNVTMVVSLHACGAASDMAMAAAVARGLPFAISPCCIGKINLALSSTRTTSRGLPPLDDDTGSAATTATVTDNFTYPRSQWLQQAVTAEEYQLLAKAADYGVVTNVDNDDATEQEVQRRQRCRRAKRVVEGDRLAWAVQHDYAVRLLELPRIGPLYPKRELLVGAPRDSGAASRMLQRFATTTTVLPADDTPDLDKSPGDGAS